MILTKSKIKFIKSLKIKKNRLIHKCFIVEGEKSVLELLSSDFDVIELYATNLWNPDVKLNKINRITEKQLRNISLMKSPNKVLAIARIPNDIVEARFKNIGITLVLDKIRDPGNLGTIIRLCDWFGVRQIICSLDTVDMFNPKVIQATMGSAFRVKILYKNLAKYLSTINEPIYGACIKGTDLKESSPINNFHLIIGNESNGISKNNLKFVTKKIAIEARDSSVDSLNVAVATAIFLYEFTS